MECGSEASAHAEAGASALQKHCARRPSPTQWERGWADKGTSLRFTSRRKTQNFTIYIQHTKNTARGAPLPRSGRGAGGEGKDALEPLTPFVPPDKGTSVGYKKSAAWGKFHPL